MAEPGVVQLVIQQLRVLQLLLLQFRGRPERALAGISNLRKSGAILAMAHSK